MNREVQEKLTELKQWTLLAGSGADQTNYTYRPILHALHFKALATRLQTQAMPILMVPVLSSDVTTCEAWTANEQRKRGSEQKRKWSKPKASKQAGSFVEVMRGSVDVRLYVCWQRKVACVCPKARR